MPWSKNNNDGANSDGRMCLPMDTSRAASAIVTKAMMANNEVGTIMMVKVVFMRC